MRHAVRSADPISPPPSVAGWQNTLALARSRALPGNQKRAILALEACTRLRQVMRSRAEALTHTQRSSQRSAVAEAVRHFVAEWIQAPCRDCLLGRRQIVDERGRILDMIGVLKVPQANALDGRPACALDPISTNQPRLQVPSAPIRRSARPSVRRTRDAPPDACSSRSPRRPHPPRAARGAQTIPLRCSAWCVTCRRRIVYDPILTVDRSR
jgi:hypothetical protein